jgi:hypothetical protein
MSHVVKQLPWCVIDIDTTHGRVFLQERWKYTWEVQPPMADWTLAEKRAFHNSVDRQIWASWSSRVRLSVTGAGHLVRRFSRHGVPINLDVRWVLHHEQWNVTVRKLVPGLFAHSTVDFAARRIELNTNTATVTRDACNAATPAVCRPGFRSSTHEFGHTLENRDEYTAGSAFLADDRSIMNVGQQLRERHFATIVRELNTMIHGVTFAVGDIHNPA